MGKRRLGHEELRRRWLERCQTGNFSQGVLGVGTVRVFGKSGDAPVTFPRMDENGKVETLAEDERWAIEVAQELVKAAQEKRRTVMATQTPQAGMLPNPTPLRDFDPKAESILILSMTTGG